MWQNSKQKAGKNMGTRKHRLLLIGPVPPPAGGVSVHIWRLKHLLQEDFEITLIDESRKIKEGFYNIRELRLGHYFSALRKAEIVSIHSGLNLLRFFHILMAKCFRKKIILTLHAYPKRKRWINRKADELIFGSCDTIISVNKEMLQNLNLPEKKTVVQYAFLPPVLEEEKELPADITHLIQQQRENFRQLIVSNAWRLDRFNDQDVYGVDMCIKAVKSLMDKGVKVHFIFNVATIDMFAAQYDAYQKLIADEGLTDYFSLVNKELSFVKLMEQADLVVRPTNTDGDSLTIWEAIYLGKPIISSDVVKRPAGTILFKNRDQEDFESKLEDCLKKQPGEKESEHSITYEHFKQLYNRLFKKLVTNV